MLDFPVYVWISLSVVMRTFSPIKFIGMETVVLEKRDGVLKITLNRPDKLNAFNATMLSELSSALRSAGKDAEVRVVVLTGAGRAFSAGQDVEEASAGRGIGDHLRKNYYPVLLQMRKLEKPVVAAVNGIAAGSGLSFVLASDITIAKESAELYFAYGAIGLIPDAGALYFAIKTIGYQRAMELSLTAARIGAREAQSMGLLNRVVPDEEFESAVDELTSTLLKMSGKAMGLTKRLANVVDNLSLEEFLEYEAMLQEVAGSTDYFREAVDRFLKGRK